MNKKITAIHQMMAVLKTRYLKMITHITLKTNNQNL